MRRVRPPQTAAPAQELPLPLGEGRGEGKTPATIFLPLPPGEGRGEEVLQRYPQALGLQVVSPVWSDFC